MSACLLILLFMLGVAVSCGPGISEEEKEAYIRGTRGPYRGQVVDSQTRDPIPGAVVVAVWYYDVPALVQTNEKFHDALEVLTNIQGYFSVDAPEIEHRAPKRTLFPSVTIFKPGYAYFRGWFASPQAMADRRNRSLLGVVELEPIRDKGRQERLRNAGVRPGGVPDEKIPSLLRAMEIERRELRHEK
ncbi:MAG: hypothetical protein ACE5JS_20955 [Nitrospinota bacterium]